MILRDVKERLNGAVEYRGKQYTLTACILRRSSGLWRYSAEIKDNKANSVVIVPLEEVT